MSEPVDKLVDLYQHTCQTYEAHIEKLERLVNIQGELIKAQELLIKKQDAVLTPHAAPQEESIRL